MAYKTSVQTQERKDKKRLHIISCAVKVFSDKGYHHTTVKDVVDQAGISVGTFYFYFKNKEDLFEEMYDTVSAEFHNMLTDAFSKFDTNLDRSFAKAITYFLKIIDMNRHLAKIMLIESVGLNTTIEHKRSQVTQQFVKITAQYLELMQQRNIIQIPDVKLWSLSFIGTLYSAIMDWLQSDTPFSLTDFAYGLTIYNMKAIGIDFNDAQVRIGIAEIQNTPLSLKDFQGDIK